MRLCAIRTSNRTIFIQTHQFEIFMTIKSWLPMFFDMINWILEDCEKRFQTKNILNFHHKLFLGYGKLQYYGNTMILLRGIIANELFKIVLYELSGTSLFCSYLRFVLELYSTIIDSFTPKIQIAMNSVIFGVRNILWFNFWNHQQILHLSHDVAHLALFLSN